MPGAGFDFEEHDRDAADALRRSEEEARARAALLEAILACIADGVIVYDREGRTVRSTPAADAMVGIPPEERSLPVSERALRQYRIWSEDGRSVGREELVAVRAAIHREAVRGVVQKVQSGEAEPRWLLMSAVPLVVAGEHTGAVLSMADVTERKRAEAELAVVSRLYAVLSRVNEAIVRTHDAQRLFEQLCRIVAGDGEFPLVWVGRIREGDVEPVAVAGPAAAYVGEIRVAVDGERGRGPTGTCIRERRPVINDDFAANPSMTPWREAAARHGLRASAAFPLWRAGAVIGALTLYAGRPAAFTPKQVQLLEALCADVSWALDAIEQERLRSAAEAALRRSEQELREADRRKDEFLAMLSHELRNPLAAIRNSGYVLQRAAPGGEQAARAREVIERQAAHLTRIVDDLLDVTRIVQGKIQLRRERLELGDLVRRAADDYRAVLAERGIAFASDLPAAPLPVEGDPARLVQVVGNLLHNAAKFARAGDRVAVALRAVEGTAELRVRDTGVGIDAALLPRLFDAFVQGERTLARTEGGLGLGLALVKGIVELHGGSVRAESAGPGRGAEFTASLPMAAQAAAAPPSGEAPRSPSRGRRVLVVDDNADAAESLCDLLRIVGHVAEVAYDGPSALEKAHRTPPDVVLCDIGLPGMDGYDVARRMRGDTALRGTRLVALTGYAQADDRLRARQAGFDTHLAKPLDLEELMGIVTSRA
jgi:PAS domain S-box-containing protein